MNTDISTRLNRHLLALLLVLLPCGIPAAWGEDLSTATHEWSILGGYGITHRGLGDTRTQVQTIDAIGRFGWFLSDEIGKGSWLQGRHELLLELPLHLTVDPRERIMTGGYILGSWKFFAMKQQRIYPYVLAGGGILFNDLGLSTQGTRLNYSYQGGIGVQKMVGDELAVVGEYRYHHISNAGTAEPNEPLNASKFLLGVTRFF
jgi:hypothetical protein